MTGTLRRGRAGASALVLALAVVLGGGCSLFSFDREAAVEDVLARHGGRLTREQAECYVDRVNEELGAGALDGEDIEPEQVSRLTRIRTDCIGVASLGAAPTAPPRTRPDGGAVGPQRPGDDPDLDALHQACAGGSGEACDRLFDAAPLGSEYEDFALTCGGRTTEARCADKYPG